MIDFNLFQFAAAPKTGTTWLLKACAAAGLGVATKTHVHSPAPHGANGPTTQPIVTLIRNPVDWLESYWSSIWPGSVGVSEIDEFRSRIDPQTKTIDEFIRQYLARIPGQVLRAFDRYGASVVLRIEDQPWALMEFFESLGVPDRLIQKVRDVGIQNPTKQPERMSRELRLAVLRAESELRDRYDY